MLPPFYYKDVTDEGLFRSYAEVIERVGNNALRIYLYHIPPIAQVGLSLDLIERLIKAYPDNVVGVKDSSGDWGNTESMLQRGWDDFRVFCGSESFLLQTMQQGGAGCISATAEVGVSVARSVRTALDARPAGMVGAWMSGIGALAMPSFRRAASFISRVCAP